MLGWALAALLRLIPPFNLTDRPSAVIAPTLFLASRLGFARRGTPMRSPAVDAIRKIGVVQ